MTDQVWELALTTGGLIIKAEILKDLHQALLLARGLDGATDGGWLLKKLTAGEAENAV